MSASPQLLNHVKEEMSLGLKKGVETLEKYEEANQGGIEKQFLQVLGQWEGHWGKHL